MGTLASGNARGANAGRMHQLARGSCEPYQPIIKCGLGHFLGNIRSKVDWEPVQTAHHRQEPTFMPSTTAKATFSPSLASITSRGHCGEAFSGSCSEWGIRTSGYEAASQRAVRRGSSYNTETMSSQHSWRWSTGSKEREHLQETKNSSGCKSNQ